MSRPQYREQDKIYREKNKEKLKAKRQDPEVKKKRSEYLKIYRENHKAKAKAYHKQYNQNPEKHKRIYENHIKHVAKNPWAQAYGGAKIRARKKGFPFDITTKYLKSIWTGKCAITGIPFIQNKERKGPNIFSPSLDKIYPNLGYVRGNCRFILFAVNAMKSDGTDADMLMIAKRIVDWNGGVTSA